MPVVVVVVVVLVVIELLLLMLMLLWLALLATGQRIDFFDHSQEPTTMTIINLFWFPLLLLPSDSDRNMQVNSHNHSVIELMVLMYLQCANGWPLEYAFGAHIENIAN